MDMHTANRAIKHERHTVPTMDDLAHTINGATVFSKLDLRSGYHQLTLTPESRYITTFATHKGLWRYNCLNFGTSSASEIFQKEIQSLLANIPGSLNISDDVIVFGHTQAEHDEALEAVCRKFSDVNLTLQKKNANSTSLLSHSSGLCSLAKASHLTRRKWKQSTVPHHQPNHRQWCKKLLRDGRLLRQIYP